MDVPSMCCIHPKTSVSLLGVAGHSLFEQGVTCVTLGITATVRRREYNRKEHRVGACNEATNE